MKVITISLTFAFAILNGGLTFQIEAAETLKLEYCVVSLIDQAQVPAEESGVLSGLSARERSEVKKGDTLAQIDDRAAVANVAIATNEYEAAKAEAMSNIRVQAATADAQVTESQYLQGAELPQQPREGEYTDQLLRRVLLAPRRAALATKVAEFDRELADKKSKVKAAELDVAELSVKRRVIVSPLDGEVVHVYRHLGEWVNPGDAVMQIVRMDQLRISGFAPADAYAPSDLIGKKVTAEVALPRGEVKTVHGELSYASSVVETSGKFRVWAEFKNEKVNGFWVLRPGLSATLTIHVE